MAKAGDSGSTPRTWAIVLTHGGAEEITAACFDSLLAQDYPALTVLLVDNASYDGSGARLRDRYAGKIEYLQTGGNFGYTGGNNRGVTHALDRGAEYAIVMNNDTILEPTCVSWLVRSALEAPERLGAVAPKILYFDDPSRIWYAGGDLSYPRAIASHRRELELDDPTERARLDPMTFATGCCFLMPAAVARAMGGFREDFFIYCEDVELSMRLVEGGYRLYYQPAARMLHREPSKPRDATPFQILHRDRNRRRIARQHFGVWQRAVFALWFYPTRFIRMTQYLLRGKWSLAGAIVKAAVVP
jgi:GT2 family glycosyltransferase